MERVRECDRKRGVVAIFDVPKADPLVRRLVVDGRPVNTRLPKPPKLSPVDCAEHVEVFLGELLLPWDLRCACDDLIVIGAIQDCVLQG